MAIKAKMRTQTEYTFDQLFQFQRTMGKTVAKNEIVRKRLVDFVWGAVAVVISILAGIRFDVPLAAVLFVPFGAILVVRSLFYHHITAWGMKNALGDKAILTEYIFEKDHIMVWQKQNSAKYPYDTCTYLLESEDCFYFIHSEGQALILSKENLKGGNADELRAFLEEKTGKTTQKA